MIYASPSFHLKGLKGRRFPVLIVGRVSAQGLGLSRNTGLFRTDNGTQRVPQWCSGTAVQAVLGAERLMHSARFGFVWDQAMIDIIMPP